MPMTYFNDENDAELNHAADDAFVVGGPTSLHVCVCVCLCVCGVAALRCRALRACYSSTAAAVSAVTGSWCDRMTALFCVGVPARRRGVTSSRSSTSNIMAASSTPSSPPLPSPLPSPPYSPSPLCRSRHRTHRRWHRHCFPRRRRPRHHFLCHCRLTATLAFAALEAAATVIATGCCRRSRCSGCAGSPEKRAGAATTQAAMDAARQWSVRQSWRQLPTD